MKRNSYFVCKKKNYHTYDYLKKKKIVVMLENFFEDSKSSEQKLAFSKVNQKKLVCFFIFNTKRLAF